MLTPLANTAVAQVFANDRTLGTGVLLDDRIVLTAAHVVPETGVGFRVRAAGVDGPGWVEAKEAWRCNALDLALIVPVAEDDAFRPPGELRPRLGIIGGQPRRARFFGAPAAAWRADLPRPNLVDLDADIRPHAFDADGFFGCAIATEPTAGDRWQGASGGPVFVGRWLAGIAVEREPLFGAQMLRVRPLAPILDQADFRAAVARHSGGAAFVARIDHLDAVDIAEEESPQLVGALEVRLGETIAGLARERRPLRNTHRMRIALDLPGGYAARCLQAVSDRGFVDRADGLINRSIAGEAAAPPSAPVDIRLAEDPAVPAARHWVRAQGLRRVDEQAWLLAILSDEGSGLNRELRARLGERWEDLLAHVARTPPPDVEVGSTFLQGDEDP